MHADDANSLPAIGFLTVLEDPQHGFFGGYLILSNLGRPLEFHCTTPVVPNEAQKILYGPTLKPYVLGELIGQTLVTKAQLSVQAIVTDLKDILSLALVSQESVVLLSPSQSNQEFPTDNSLQPVCDLGSYRLLGASSELWQPDQLKRVFNPLCEHVDLAEPFDRIREAIREAQRISDHQAHDDHEPMAAA